jgi:hypothetical protein
VQDETSRRSCISSPVSRDIYFNYGPAFLLHFVKKVVPDGVVSRQQYFLFREVLPEMYEVFYKFELSKIEVGEVGKLVVDDEFVEGI